MAGGWVKTNKNQMAGIGVFVHSDKIEMLPQNPDEAAGPTACTAQTAEHEAGECGSENAGDSPGNAAGFSENPQFPTIVVQSRRRRDAAILPEPLEQFVGIRRVG